MRIFQAKVFDGYIRGTGAVFTQTADSELIGSAERLVFYAVMNGVSGTSPSLTIQLENSPDGTRWLNQATGPEVSAMLNPGDNSAYGTSAQSTTIPMAAYIRMRITLGGTDPGGYLRLWLNGRSPA